MEPSPDYFGPDAVLDSDGDGYPDTAMVDINSDGLLDTALVDTNRDSLIDTALVDTNSDSLIDTVVVDTDSDGRLDRVVAEGNGGRVPDFTGLPQDGASPTGPPQDVTHGHQGDRSTDTPSTHDEALREQERLEAERRAAEFASREQQIRHEGMMSIIRNIDSG